MVPVSCCPTMAPHEKTRTNMVGFLCRCSFHEGVRGGFGMQSLENFTVYEGKKDVLETLSNIIC